MRLYFFRKLDGTYANAFREIALHHNIRISKLFAATIGIIGLILTLIDKFTNSGHVFKYPNEYSAAILFIFLSSCACYVTFIVCDKLSTRIRSRIYKFLARIYPLVVVVSSLWITFVMQHNPSNTMSVFVLGLLMVASLWIFDGLQAILIATGILVLFNLGLHYFQTDPCKLFANYITGSCVAVFFVCVSRVSFSINYNHFLQLKKIEQFNESIIKANRRQTEILGVVTHDLRAPINNILGLTDLLKNSGPTAEERDEYYDLILETCNRSKTIIDDLLNSARSKELDTKFAYICMNDLVENIVYKFSKRKAKSREISYTNDPEKIYAYVDRLKIIRLFDNLLSNAVKFTKDDGMIMVTMNHDPEKIYISVIDNGIGIPKDMMPFLFNKFPRSGREGLSGEKSYGLGLNICKLIAEQHLGSISADSEEGKGTQMKITLPRAGKFQ